MRHGCTTTTQGTRLWLNFCGRIRRPEPRLRPPSSVGRAEGAPARQALPPSPVYARLGMQAFAVVIALLAVAVAGWLLSRWARSLLRSRGLPTDERDVPDVSRPVRLEEDGGRPGDGGQADDPGRDPA